MEAAIRYATTSDGVNIAFFAIGKGPAVVTDSLPLSHVQLEWELPGNRETFASIARVATWVRFDHRGFGMSDRNVSDFSLESLVRDIEAVVDKLQLPRFSLVANAAASPICLAYAALNSDRIARLALQPGFDRPSGPAWNQWQKLAEMGAEDWEFASEAMLRTIMGWDTTEARAHAALLREAISPAQLGMYLRDAKNWDARPYVPKVTCPTLLTEVTATAYTTMENARALAALLPNASMAVSSEGTRTERLAQSRAATARFLGADPSTLGRGRSAPSTTIILFADIADSTALTERIGDAAFREKARALDDALRIAVRDHGGAVIDAKTLGDGILATFPAASQAIAAALACGASGDAQGLPLHLGLHAGDVIRESDNVYGGAVNIAARISALAAPGEVLVSATVRDLGRTSAGVVFEDRGEHSLKGIADPQRVFAVRPA